MEIAAREQEYRVAVDHLAGLVGEQDTVGIAIECDADGGLVLHHFRSDDVGIQGSAAEVDVAAVGARMGHDYLAAEVREELWSYRARRTVRAIDHDAVVIERKPRNRRQQEANVLRAIGLVDWRGLRSHLKR